MAISQKMCSLLGNAKMNLAFILLIIIQTVIAQQQTFRTAPADTEVKEGQTVQLQCEVNNKKGPLQWTKDGYALGFSRDIPGYPRYSMTGAEALGEYNLMILEARLEDDGEYQCQVGPFDTDKPLLGVAQLSVLIPPEHPVIEGYMNGSMVKVPHEQESLSLTCSSANGKPAAEITWKRNDEEITEGLVYTTESAGDKLLNAKSVLTFSPQSEDNDQYFSCEASNGAIMAPKITIVQLSVMHPPSAPEITGYTTGDVVKTGNTLKLVCLSRGGNPLAQVYWYKNDVELDFSYISGNNRAENELIFNIQPNDNEAVYRCEASNLVTPEPLKKEVKLTVQFAPERVAIQGHQNAKAGDTIKLKCVTAISNPPADITWFSRGRQLSGATSETSDSPEGGFVTVSEITVELTDRENDVIYQCHATNNALGKTVVDTVTLQVMYPPEKPTISGYTEGKPKKAGTGASLTCTSVGGNPPATLTWWKGDSEIKGTQARSGNMVSNQIAFLLRPDDNEADYRCNATNVATINPLLSSIRLTIHFPPQSLDISTSPIKGRVGQKLVVTCKSATSNPPSELSWWKDGDEIEGIDGGQIDSAYGGKSTISRLEVTPTEQDDGEIYACRATNELLEEAVSDAVTLNVLYKPMFPSDVPSKVDVVEFQATVINVTALGNPATVEYKWTKNGEKITFGPGTKSKRAVRIPHFIQDGPILNLNNVTRTDTGIYVVEGKNDEGSTEFNIDINVQYAAGISSVSKNVLVDKDSSAVLECIVEGNPMLDNMVTWSRAGYDMSKTSVEYSEGRSLLHVANVTKADSGMFVCTANNNIGKPATANAELMVKYAPEIDESPAYGKAAAGKGGNATLKCKAEGAPKVSFVWFRGDSQLDVTGLKYIEKTDRSLLVYYESHLKVVNVTRQDYGQYMCVARNELGQDSMLITVDDTSSPDPPYDIQFINATHNTITLSWKPGFDGGSPTVTFQVRYSEVGEAGFLDHTKYEDVSPKGATIYAIKGLKLATEYQMTVKAMNIRGDSSFQEKSVMVRTSAVAPSTDDGSSDDVPLIIILTVSIIGMVLLGLNILLILFFIRRRKKKLEKAHSETGSQANTLEMFNAPTITEDSKSYTTYERRSPEDFPDEYRPYDVDDEMRRFLPPPYPSLDLYGPPQPGYYGPLPPTGEYSPSPGLDNQRVHLPPDKDPVYGPNPGSYGPPDVHDPNDDDYDYAEQLRRTLGQGKPNGHVPRHGGSASHLAHPPISSSPIGKNPPAPPTRSSSKDVTANMGKPTPPIPSRNYAPDDVPRYGPPPGSAYGRSDAPPLPPDDMRGHLV